LCHTAEPAAHAVCLSAGCLRVLLAIVGLASPIAAADAEAVAHAPAARFADLRLGLAHELIDGNLILRQPFLVGGVSFDAAEREPDVSAFGAFARAGWDPPAQGELVFGGNYVEAADSRQWEVQARYVAPGGLGMGAGYADLEASGDTWFVNPTVTGKSGTLNYHLGPVAQNGPGGLSVGAYAALYTGHLFLGGGNDGEHWRLLAAWSANNGERAVDPSLEVLFVDHGIGRLDGERFLFVNGSLKRNAGFLSTGSRLGRALGPQGMQFANPVSFLSQPWSRTADVWETGGVMNLRLARREFPGGRTSLLAQGVVFPFQAQAGDVRLRGIFAGVQYQRDALRATSLLFGHAGRYGRLSLSIAGSYDTERRQISGVLGVRIHF